MFSLSAKTLQLANSTLIVGSSHLFAMKQSQSFLRFKQTFKSKKGKKGTSSISEEEPQITFDINEMKEKMNVINKQMQTEFDKIHVDRLDPSIYERLSIPTNNGNASLSSLAQVVVKNPLSISITVFDASMVSTIYKTLKESNLNVNPQINKTTIQIPIPKTTKEKREQIVKQMNTQSELYKNKVKNVRKYYMDVIKQMEKQSASKDQIKRYQNDIQKVVDSTNNEINSLLKQKSNEILNGSK